MITMTPNAPLSLRMLGSTPLVRMHKLLAIDVTALESAANSEQPCSGPMRSLRASIFKYQNDADTGQLQLHRVTMIGQENTNERNVALPVATYTYGRVTSNGELNYQLRLSHRSMIAGFAIAKTANIHPDPVTAPRTNPLPTSDAFTRKNLLDANGDGWPDLLYTTNGGHAERRGAQQAGSRQSRAIALSAYR